jgi:hypothetical protein
MSKSKKAPTRRALPLPVAPPGPVVLDMTAAVGVGHSGERTDAPGVSPELSPPPPCAQHLDVARTR